jgi:hypothetical protein
VVQLIIRIEVSLSRYAKAEGNDAREETPTENLQLQIL